MTNSTALEPDSSDDSLRLSSTSVTRPSGKAEYEAASPKSPWKWHDHDFGKVLGEKPRLELVLELSYPFAHEAGVYFQQEDELFITSNRLIGADSERVQISKVNLKGFREDTSTPAGHEEIDCEHIRMGNGGVNYRGGILFCDQGSRTSPGGLYWMSRTAPYQTTPILTNYHGVPFNSVNDVVVSKVDGSIWFTDPPYGSEQGYKGAAMLPGQVYCYSPPKSGSTGEGSLRAVADGFGHPNGLCFSPDESVMYITDTDKQHGSGRVHLDRPSSIYAYDVVTRHNQRFLLGRRLFAFVEAGIPDGIKCDTTGRVYSGCGDGIHVWSPGGVLLGRILLDGGVANFCFGRPGEIFALNEAHMWRVQLAPVLQGALLSNLGESSPSDGQASRHNDAAHSASLWQRVLRVFRKR